MSSEFKFELEQSKYLNLRAALVRTRTAPQISDAKRNLGDKLSDILFEQCHEALKGDIGLNNPLKGPGRILWLSPSDLLIGKVALKPPFTPKCLQALTHRGILSVGQDLENKFRQEMDVEKQKALDDLRRDLLAAIEDKLKTEVRDAEMREKVQCRIEIDAMKLEFQNIMGREIDILESGIREEFEQILANQEAALEESFEERLQAETQKCAEKITERFMRQLDRQEVELAHIFRLELRKQELARSYDAVYHQKKMMTALHQLRHNLECTNLVNMMYLLCKERNICQQRKQKIETHYQMKIRILEDELHRKDDLLDKLTREKNQQIQETHLRETCLKQVIKHFQKFINFALKAAPTQAEFLLSLEKMMVFELTTEILKTDVNKVRECPMPGVVPWQFKEIEEAAEVAGLEVDDHHDCFNELNPPVTLIEGNMNPADTLPAFVYNNKTYIREDFRDMLAANIPISPSNELWNKDVEELVTHWEKKVLHKSNSSESVVIDVDEYREDADTASEFMERKSQKSAVQFTEETVVKQEFKVSSKKRSSEAVSQRRSSLKPSLFPGPITSDPVIVNDSGLLAAKDSLEMIRIHKVHSPIQEEPEEEVVVHELKNNLAVEARDSIILRKTELEIGQETFSVKVNDSVELLQTTKDVSSKSSKLQLARNSVELLKESLMKLTEPSLFCQRPIKPVECAIQTPSFATTCCEQCHKRRHQERLELTDGSDRSVRISRVEIINLDDAPYHQKRTSRSSSVYFKPEAIVIDEVAAPDVKSKKKRSSSSSTKKSKPIRNRCGVSGSSGAKEGGQTNDEFTAERIHSLVKLMSECPHLLRLFTTGGK